jgi:hypothetical protein
VHRPVAKLRQADGEREQSDGEKDRPADFWWRCRNLNPVLNLNRQAERIKI